LRRNRYGTGQQDIVDEYQSNDPSYIRITTFATLYGTAAENDTLSLWIYPVTGFNSLTANPSPYYEWIRTKVLYKKLGVDDTTHYFE
jgi:hypothetical protein